MSRARAAAVVWLLTFVGCGALEPAARHHEPMHVARGAGSRAPQPTKVRSHPTAAARARLMSPPSRRARAP